MNYEQALDIVIGRTKNERLRLLCDESNPDHRAWRVRVVELARNPPDATPPAPIYQIPLAGDLVAAMTKRMGIDRLAKYIAEQLGGECHCPERQEKLNRLDARLRKWLGMG